ncbi:unnamed protein product [Ilex paraguariensis]|uniref:Protein kinase domain-containing protein n=1 Tax=Ilex paraguariensis TaxID=185542 RepID=A0ABC8S3B8_9AQUA
MAPEMLQLQKYDAKADLWSVGAILFQLVTGKTPFTGVNEIQLLQNIVKSTELHFPPDKRDLSAGCIDLCQKLLRCNPVERLTFAEFFNHPFLSQTQPDASSRNWRSSRIMVPLPGGKPLRNTDESSQEDCLPFRLDDDSSSPDGSPSFIRRSPLGSTCANTKNKTDHTSKFSSVTHNPLNTGFRIDSCRPSEGNMKESSKSMDHRPVNTPSNVIESMEFIERDYVFVSGPPMDVSISASGSKPSHLLSKSGSPPLASGNINSTSSSPMQIIGAATSNIGCVGSFERQSFVPFGTSPGSVNAWDVLEQRSTDCLRRIRSLQQCASAITELVKEKIEAERQLDAFSIQLVILAILKQALRICHAQAASAIEGCPSQEVARLREVTSKEHVSPNIQEHLDTATQGPHDVLSQMKRAFICEVVNAEELVQVIEPGTASIS